MRSSPRSTLSEPYQQIEDYKILAEATDWAEHLNQLWEKKTKTDTESLKLLDVGCGIGRWLTAFQNMLGEKSKIALKCDLLDPSIVALKEAAKTLNSPLYLGEIIQSVIQNIELAPCNYDIIWAIHSFYSIPKNDLSAILQKCINGLKAGGELFVALTSNKSFYIQSYDQFRASFSFNQIDSYTSAEMILNAFQSLNQTVEVKVINYVEKVAFNDMQKLSHYILNECIGYSFNRDDDTTKELNISDLLNHPKMGAFLRSYIIGNHYEFPQELWLFSAKKTSF